MRISDWSSDVALPISMAVNRFGGGCRARDIAVIRKRHLIALDAAGRPRHPGRAHVDKGRAALGLAFMIGAQARPPTPVRLRKADAHRGHDDAIAKAHRADHPRRKQVSVWSFGHKRSEEHTSELQSLMRISYAVFCLKKK